MGVALDFLTSGGHSDVGGGRWLVRYRGVAGRIRDRSIAAKRRTGDYAGS